MNTPASTLLGNWRDGRGPAYRKLAEALRAAIDRSDLPAGARLPAERALAEDLGVSRTTVIAAYDALRSDGRIRSRRGSGTRVAGAPATGVPGASGRPSADAIRPNVVFRGLIEAADASIELLSVQLPPARPFLEEAMAETAADAPRLLRHHGYTGLGLPELREAIASHLTSEGLSTRPEEILVTHGAQQAIALAARHFVEPGGAAVLEDPTYLGAIDVLVSAGARLVPIGTGPAGASVEDLRIAVHRERPSLVYLMPSFQNPVGGVVPESARREIGALVAARDIPLVEDDTLAHLDFGQRPPRSIAALCPAARVLSVGSLSKLMWGGLRVGWIRGPRADIDRLARLKVMEDLGNSVVSQAVAARLLGRVAKVRELRRKQIRERYGVLSDEIARRLKDWSAPRPAGGLSVWAKLPRGNAAEFAAVARRFGVSILPGSTCSPSGRFPAHVRIPFGLEPDRIREGVKRLARAWREYSPSSAESPSRLDVVV
jgi:DNA-binding transcriptional MocR family regulator